MLLLFVATGGLINLLITVVIIMIVGGLIFWCVNALSRAFGIPEPVRTVIIVILVIVLVLGLLSLLLGGGGVGALKI